MKAIVYSRYGSPDVLRYEDVDKPVPGDDEVLIKVRAASLNPVDWHFLRGSPFLARIILGLRAPKTGQLGVNVAGEVEAVGKKVTRFKPDDAVFGSCSGAFAEYARTAESRLVLKPHNITFEQGAAVATGALTALQALRRAPAKSVLINGASGGVGTFAVQLAKWMGMNVTAVCSTRNVDMVRSLGADEVIDYTRTDFTKNGKHYDMILDNIGNRPLLALKRVLTPNGTYVPIGGTLKRFLRMLLLSPFIRLNFRTFLTRPSQDDLALISQLLESGKVTPVIDRRYSLSEVPEAMRYLEEGHARGKIVITVGKLKIPCTDETEPPRRHTRRDPAPVLASCR